MLRNHLSQYKKKIDFRSIIGFIISGTLLLYTVKKSEIGWRDLHFTPLSWAYFTLAVVAFIIAIYVQSKRAKIIWLERGKKQYEISTYESLVIGNFYNCILPGNLGEGVRAYHFGKKNNVNFSQSLSSIITEKWIDAQVFIVLSIILFIGKPFQYNYIMLAIGITSTAIVIFWTIYVIMQKYKSVEKYLWKKVVAVLGKLGLHMYRLYIYTSLHIQHLIKKKIMLRYLVAGMLIFFLNLAQFYILLIAAGVNENITTLYTSYFIALSMMIIAFIPSAPSNIGVMHYGVYSVLIVAAHQYGVIVTKDMLQTFAIFSIYVHLSYFIPEIGMGAIFLIKERQIIFKKNIPNH